jgi:hypothetical protein
MIFTKDGMRIDEGEQPDGARNHPIGESVLLFPPISHTDIHKIHHLYGTLVVLTKRPKLRREGLLHSGHVSGS